MKKNSMNIEFDLIIVVYGCDSIDKYKNQILKIKETYEKTIDRYDNIKIIYFLGPKHDNCLENENIDITISFAKRYAEYTETISTLQGLASKGGRLGEKAKEVLELLHPKNTIAEHLEHFSSFEGIGHVGKETLREIVVNNRISEVIYLKGELRK